MKWSDNIIALILAIGLVIAVVRTTSIPSENMLAVSGSADITVPPDQATIYAYIETKEATAAESQQQNAEISTNVLSALIKAGIAKEDIETYTYSVYPEYYYPENSDRVLSGYRTVHGLKIKTKSVEKAGDFIDAASKAGANRFDNINFDLSDKKAEDARLDVLAKATLNAKSKAQAIAAKLGLKLGKITGVSESSFNVVPYSVSAEKAMAATQIAPRNVELSATVSVSYKI